MHPSSSDFEVKLAAIDVEPGQSYYAARRSLWLAPVKSQPVQRQQSASVMKLETMMSDPDALRSRKVWNAGLGEVWKGLLDGGRLKHNLPLYILIKVLQAGWLRDGTWPEDAEAPDTPT